jgi:hypothetical protein
MQEPNYVDRCHAYLMSNPVYAQAFENDDTATLAEGIDKFFEQDIEAIIEANRPQVEPYTMESVA